MDCRPNHRNKAVFPNVSNVYCERIRTVEVQGYLDLYSIPFGLITFSS